MRSLEILPSGPLGGALKAPASKSVTNRLLVLAGLAEGTSTLGGVLVSDDTTVMAEGLRVLGAQVSELGAGGPVEVMGTSGELRQPAGAIWAGASGTTLRFLACVALLVRGTATLDGEAQLRSRPVTGLLDVLEALGAAIETDGGRLPLRITSSGLGGGAVDVDAAASSQFASGLLLVAPYAAADMRIVVRNLGAGGYVELTVEAMRRWGAEISVSEGGTFEVPAGHRYRSRHETVEYDASAAAHLFALAMATGGSVTVTNAVATRQPDAGIVAVFEAMGATVSTGERGLTVTRSGDLCGVEVDVSAMPDQLPTLAALGALAGSTTRLVGVSVARGHETDRVTAIAKELSSLGADVSVEADVLVVRGGRTLHGGVLNTYGDHRMAMALSAAAAVVPGVSIREPGCVRKTYPGYWADTERLGMRVIEGS